MADEQNMSEGVKHTMHNRTKRYRVTGQVMSVNQIERLRDSTPIEALWLNEDLHSIQQAMKLLKGVDPCNITESILEKDREFGYNMHALVLMQLKTWERFAQLKLRRKYLAQ